MNLVRKNVPTQNLYLVMIQQIASKELVNGEYQVEYYDKRNYVFAKKATDTGEYIDVLSGMVYITDEKIGRQEGWIVRIAEKVQSDYSFIPEDALREKLSELNTTVSKHRK